MFKTNMKFGGVMSYHAPLFSFHSIYDIDIGLVNLIREKYLNEKVFDPLFFKQSKLKIISDMYKRKESNPLTVFAKSNISKDDLDDYYKQFLEKEYKYIYDECVSTEILNYINIFADDKEINPIVLCYNDYEEKIVKEEDKLKNVKIVRLNKDNTMNVSDQRSYSEFFVKRVEEIDIFNKVIDFSFYISSFRPNFEENSKGELVLKSTKMIEINIMIPSSSFNIYDMYNGKYFERI